MLRMIKFFSILIMVIVLSFTLVSFSPVDPIQSYLGAEMMVVSETQKEQIAEYYGLHEPKLKQFFKWFSTFVQGDFGVSLLYRQDVLTVIKERFRSEEHTSELQSRENLVCRLLLEKKKFLDSIECNYMKFCANQFSIRYLLMLNHDSVEEVDMLVV